MKKITLTEFLDSLTTNAKNPHSLKSHIKESLSNLINKPEDATAGYDYWIQKRDLINKTNTLFSEATDILSPIKRIHKKESIQDLANKFYEYSKNSIFDFSDLLNFDETTDISVIKEQLNTLFNTFGLLGDYARIDGYKFFDINNFFADENFSQNEFANLLGEFHHEWILSPSNIIKLFSKDSTTYNSESPPKYLSLRFLQTNIVNQIDDIFNEHLLILEQLKNKTYLSDEEKKSAIYNQENIFAKILNNGFAKKKYSSFSNEFSFLTFSKDQKNDFLNKIFPISFGEHTTLERIFKDLSLKLSPSRNVAKKPFSDISNYVDNLDQKSKKEFFTKYPSLINFLEVTDLKMIEDIANNYFNNFEFKFLKSYDDISKYLTHSRQTSIESLKKESTEFFFRSISSRFSQSHLDKFDNKDIPQLFEKITAGSSLKIKKSNYILKYIKDNKLNPNILPFVSLYDSKLTTVESAIEFLQLDNNLDFSNHHFSNVLSSSLASKDLSRSYKKQEEIKTKMAESIFSYLNDETKDLNVLKNLFITHYQMARVFFDSLPISELDRELNPIIINTDFSKENNDEALIGIRVSFAIYQNINNPQFQRYKEILKFCLDTELCFTRTYGYRNSVYVNSSDRIEEQEYNFPRDEETIFSKFHLLNNYFESLLDFSAHGNSYPKQNTELSELSELSDSNKSSFKPRGIVSPLQKHDRSSSRSTNTYGFKDLTSPIDLNNYVSYSSPKKAHGIIDNYNQHQRNILINNQFKNMNKDVPVVIKKKI